MIHRSSARLLLAGLLSLGVAARAQSPSDRKGPASSLLTPVGTRPGETADTVPRAWHPDCALPPARRRPISLVLGLDAHRDYRPANDFEAAQLKPLIAALCPGDRLVLVEVGKVPKLLGEPATLGDLSDVDDLLLRVEERKDPRHWRRGNAALLDVAVLEWGRRQNTERPDLLRVLVFLTRDLESKAAKAEGPVPDFSWASPPYWLAGHALVAVFRPITSESAVEAWEVFVTTTPAGVEKAAIGQGLRVDPAEWLSPARVLPEPERRPRRDVQELQIELPAAEDIQLGLPLPRALFPEPDGILRWDRQWTPWAVAAGLALLLVVVGIWTLFRAAPRRLAAPAGVAPTLTLVLHDRLHERVVSHDAFELGSPIRVGASLSSDLTVAGPYALEILPGPPGGSPRARSTNSLPVEIQRAAGGRILRATEGVALPLRSGDRIRLGGGLELEVRVA